MKNTSALTACLVVAALLAGVAGCSDGASSAPRPTGTSTQAAVATSTSTQQRATPINTAVPEPSATPQPTQPPVPTQTPQPTQPPAPTLPPAPTQPPVPAQPAAPPPTQPPPQPPAPAGPATLALTARNLAFEQTALSARPGASVSIVMSNQDNFVSHDVAIAGIGTSRACAGPCTSTLSFTAPAPGSYQYICSIHPATMIGTLFVQ